MTTIVVLLIIAVVTIGAVKDSNIIGYAQNASDEYTIGKEKEELELAVMEAMLAENGKFNLDIFKSKYIPDNFTSNGDGTYESNSGNKFEVNENGNVTYIEAETPEDGESDTPSTGDDDTDLDDTPIIESEAWSALGLEVAGEEFYVQYDKLYSNSDLPLLEPFYGGFSIKIYKEGGLFSADTGRGNDYDIDEAEVTDDEVKFYINNGYACAQKNFVSFICAESDNATKFIGIKFKENGKADVYWENSLITDISGLTPVGTLSIVE